MSERIGRFFCWLGFHDYVPIRWLTCNPNDTGYACRKCDKELSQ